MCVNQRMVCGGRNAGGVLVFLAAPPTELRFSLVLASARKGVVLRWRRRYELTRVLGPLNRVSRAVDSYVDGCGARREPLWIMTCRGRARTARPKPIQWVSSWAGWPKPWLMGSARGSGWRAASGRSTRPGRCGRSSTCGLSTTAASAWGAWAWTS